MKKIYRMKELDCANCAAKMERAIRKIKGVEDASISFMTQRLTLECEEAMLPQILEQARLAVAKVDPHCQILGG